MINRMNKEKCTLKLACNTIDELQTYLSEKAVNHQNYKHYVPDIKRIYNIYHEGALFLTDGSNWNDPDDKKAFTYSNLKSGCKKYGLCLSYSKSENVAMWMLYGGMQKRGAMIDINPKSIKQLLNASDRPRVELGNFEGGHWNSEMKLNKSEYEVELTDVLYYDTNKGENEIINNEEIPKYNIKRSDEKCQCNCNLIDNAVLLQKKVWAWNYENECRLIISVKTKQIIEKKDLNITVARVEFPSKESFKKDIRNRIILAPNFQENAIEEKHFPFKKSLLKIDWDLCKGCSKDDSFLLWKK